MTEELVTEWCATKAQTYDFNAELGEANLFFILEYIQFLYDKKEYNRQEIKMRESAHQAANVRAAIWYNECAQLIKTK